VTISAEVLTQNNELSPLISLNIFLKHAIDDWVNVLVNIFEKERESVFNGKFKLFQEVRAVEG